MFEQIKKLEIAHRSLMEEYVEIINATSKLPFLVDIFSLKSFDFGIPINTRVLEIIKVISYVPRFLIKFFCWKPFVKFFVESHIKSKAEEIKNSYIQLSQVFSPFMKTTKEYQWLIDSNKSLGEFSSTLSSWKNMAGIWVIAINLVAGIYGVKTVFELLPQIQSLSPNNVSSLAKEFGSSLTNLLMFLTIFFVFPFWAKRFLFNPSPSRNIYQTENIVFEITQKAKSLEIPIDYLLLLLYLVIYPILIIIMAIWIVTQGFSIPVQFKNTDIPLLISFSTNYILLLLIISAFIFVAWKFRKWR